MSTIRVEIKKCIQESQYEPFSVTLEMEKEVSGETKPINQMRKLYDQLEEELDEIMENRLEALNSNDK